MKEYYVTGMKHSESYNGWRSFRHKVNADSKDEITKCISEKYSNFIIDNIEEVTTQNNINIRNLIFDENAFKDWTTSKSPIYYCDDLMGKITCGAVCCELYLSDNSNKDYCIGQNALNAYILLLGKDGGLMKDNIPYSQEGSFFCRSFDTYKETMEGIIEDFCKIIQDNPELKAGAKRTDLTWDEVYNKSFPGLTSYISWDDYSETLNHDDDEIEK